MGAADRSTLVVAWADAVAGLAIRGWARAPRALDEGLAARLADDDGRQWRIAGDEGVVQQHVIGSYTPFVGAPAVVRAVGDELVARLSAEALLKELPEIPPCATTLVGPALAMRFEGPVILAC